MFGVGPVRRNPTPTVLTGRQAHLTSRPPATACPSATGPRAPGRGTSAPLAGSPQSVWLRPVPGTRKDSRDGRLQSLPHCPPPLAVRIPANGNGPPPPACAVNPGGPRNPRRRRRIHLRRHARRVLPKREPAREPGL